MILELIGLRWLLVRRRYIDRRDAVERDLVVAAIHAAAEEARTVEEMAYFLLHLLREMERP
jgi:hypothetical protein